MLTNAGVFFSTSFSQLEEIAKDKGRKVKTSGIRTCILSILSQGALQH